MPAFIKALVALSVVLTVTALVLMFSAGVRRAVPVTD